MILSPDIFNKIFIVFFAYFSVLMLYYLALGCVGLFESKKKNMEHNIEDYTTFCVSTFTIPVTMIIPAHNEEAWISDALQAVLNLDYPEFEVIVVNDESTDRTFEIVDSLLDLKPIDYPYVDRFQVGKVLGLFKSKKFSNVTVLNKASGTKKAGALNAALNLAKYKYVCVIDGDTILEPDALLKVMIHVQKEPETVIGIGSYFGLVNGFKLENGKIVKRSFSRRPIIAYQNLEYIRSFIGNRIAWSHFNATPIVSGGFAVWRRDMALALGGFAPEYSSEDLEFTFRAQEYITKNKTNSKILMLPYYVGWTAGPTNVRSLILQRNRWQRVADEAVRRYKHMILNPRYKTFGLFTIPYFLFYEVFGVFFELSSMVLAIVGFVTRLVSFKIFMTFFCFMILSQAFISLLSLFIFSRDQKLMTFGDIAYLGFLSLIEFFWYRWIIMVAKLTGTLSYLRGVRSFDQFGRTEV